jgi:hypothetical protein
MPNITEIIGGAGGDGTATGLAQITRRAGDQQIATELAEMACVASGRVVSTAHGTGR